MPRGKKSTKAENESHKRKEETSEVEPSTKHQKVESEPGVHHSGHSQKSSIIERGHIFFFYRPKVEHKEAHSMEDVQRLYMCLCPIGSSDTVKRLLVITRKMLPETDEKSRLGHSNKFWSFVEKASQKVEDIDAALGEEHYETQTRGDRFVAAARPVAEGFYAIVTHEKGHTHLAYVLELPKELGPVQKAFHIHKEGSFVISVKNPQREAKGFFRGLAKKAHYPEELQKKFEGRAWLPVDPTRFLDFPNAEVLIIGATDDIVKEFGKVGEKIESDEEKDMKHISKDSLFEELHLSKKEHPPKAFYTGRWE